MKSLLPKILRNISNIIFGILLIVLIWKRGPIWYSHFSMQGQSVGTFKVLDQNALPLQLSFQQPTLLVFWATWCGPCEIELSRIKSFVAENNINPSRIILVSGDEEIPLLKEEIKKRGYPFNYVFDVFGELRTFFKVEGTPNLVLLNKDDGGSQFKVVWQTMGLSPTLDFRLGSLK